MYILEKGILKPMILSYFQVKKRKYFKIKKNTLHFIRRYPVRRKITQKFTPIPSKKLSGIKKSLASKSKKVKKIKIFALKNPFVRGTAKSFLTRFSNRGHFVRIKNKIAFRLRKKRFRLTRKKPRKFKKLYRRSFKARKFFFNKKFKKYVISQSSDSN